MANGNTFAGKKAGKLHVDTSVTKVILATFCMQLALCIHQCNVFACVLPDKLFYIRANSCFTLGGLVLKNKVCTCHQPQIPPISQDLGSQAQQV